MNPEAIRYFTGSKHPVWDYDSDTESFTVEGQAVSMVDILQILRSAGEPLDEEAVQNMLENEFLTMMGPRPVMLSRTKAYLQRCASKPELLAELNRDVGDVIARSYERASKELGVGQFAVAVEFMKNRGGVVGPGIIMPACDIKGISVQTFGNTCDWGVERNVSFGNLLEFDMLPFNGTHNIDNDAQKISLLAGIGHIARLASRDQMNTV
ncbi:hypothetical protein FACS189431_3300 [Alphaproteobacteria bacterium]|nr:hypothetical protein FACS189431_3300 [Alphaproteobacteria bacterium]